MPIKEMQVDTWMQKRHASAAHFNAANKRSLELTMLEGGYLGVHKISCDLAMDTDERDRWDRAVKHYQGTIEKLTREVAELKALLAAGNGSRVHAAERNARVSDESPVVNQPEVDANSACISQSLMHPTPPLTASASESRTAPMAPVSNQDSPNSQVASPAGNALSGDEPDLPPADLEGVNQVIQEPQNVRDQEIRSAGGEEMLNPSSPHPLIPSPNPESSKTTVAPAPQYRWEDSFRQEALDFHCLKFGLPPATTDMATGIPDPFKMSPRLWIERGYPYMIHIDRTIPCDRRNPLDTMRVIKLACHPVVKGSW